LHYDPRTVDRLNYGQMKRSSQSNAFVVRFEPETDAAAGRVLGRIEHVASWQATHFRSVDELLAFVARVLAEAGGERDGEESAARNANS
jgi:hypothetical protein